MSLWFNPKFGECIKRCRESGHVREETKEIGVWKDYPWIGPIGILHVSVAEPDCIFSCLKI